MTSLPRPANAGLPRLALAALVAAALCPRLPAQEQPEVSGVYPHLALFNQENECGIGAVVPWAGRLWVITYAPHKPRGSTDKLYSIGTDLTLEVHPESVGGTPASRMIHDETQQLVLGPYVIDAEGKVRVVPPDRMPGRLTGVARHLTAPERKVYVATMEEGLYELDLITLEVRELYADDQGQLSGKQSERRIADLPGYHGKGLYSGQGRVVYANNGQAGAEAQRHPDLPSGCLAEWDGDSWRVVRRNQFTEVTGPGGIHGNPDADGDPLWSIGWDQRSLILMLLDDGEWSEFRLPKGSHSYDGAHGWNTEWPRIRDVGEASLLMTMHGTFWDFPRTFSAGTTAGIVPRSNYLRVVGDFARWGDRIVFGCDDVARSQFLNKRRAHGSIAGPGQSHSNLWSVDPESLDHLGPALGRGAVWLDEDVEAESPSDPFLFGGYDQRGVHLSHGEDTTRSFVLEIDVRGDGDWSELEKVDVEPRGYAWEPFDDELPGAWVRVRLEEAATNVTAQFAYRNRDPRGTEPDSIFEGLALLDDDAVLGGRMRVRGDDLRTLALVGVHTADGSPATTGFFELDETLLLRRRDDAQALAWHEQHLQPPTGIVTMDQASVLYIDDEGRRWRLPRALNRGAGSELLGTPRLCREVVTERDLFHVAGTFYELPARNAGGFALLRPIASHPFLIHDFAGYRGLLVLTGLRGDAEAGPHVVRSTDGEAAVWVGVIDDLWRLGRPTGLGGPWFETSVQADVPSDPYLLTGFERRELQASHDAEVSIPFELQVDATGTGAWHTWQRIKVPPGKGMALSFPPAFEAYWLRVAASDDCTATVQLIYH